MEYASIYTDVGVYTHTHSMLLFTLKRSSCTVAEIGTKSEMWANQDSNGTCVKPATSTNSAFIWQLTWIGCDEKRSTPASSCQDILNNACIMLSWNADRVSMCHCERKNEWISSRQSLLCTPEGPFLSLNTQQQLRQQDSSGMRSLETGSSSPIMCLDVNVVTGWKVVLAATITYLEQG